MSTTSAPSPLSPYDQLLEDCRAAVRAIQQVTEELNYHPRAEVGQIRVLLGAAAVLEQYFAPVPPA